MPPALSYFSQKSAGSDRFGLSIPAIGLALDHADPAPRFRAKTMDGEIITNDSIRGKMVLLQFWATWCPYCKRDMPALERSARNLAVRAWWYTE